MLPDSQRRGKRRYRRQEGARHSRHPAGGSREVKNTSRWRQQGFRRLFLPQRDERHESSGRGVCLFLRWSAFERRVEAASAVDGFGARRLSSLLTELLAAHGAAEPRVRRLVLLIKRSCQRHRDKSEDRDQYYTYLTAWLIYLTIYYLIADISVRAAAILRFSQFSSKKLLKCECWTVCRT